MLSRGPFFMPALLLLVLLLAGCIPRPLDRHKAPRHKPPVPSSTLMRQCTAKWMFGNQLCSVDQCRGEHHKFARRPMSARPQLCRLGARAIATGRAGFLWHARGPR